MSAAVFFGAVRGMTGTMWAGSAAVAAGAEESGVGIGVGDGGGGAVGTGVGFTRGVAVGGGWRMASIGVGEGVAEEGLSAS
jgi:hypothetical protein